MDNEDQSFWDHLHELRKYLIRSVLLFIVFFIAAFSFREILFDQFLLALLNKNFISYQWFLSLAEWSGLVDSNDVNIGFSLISTRLAGQFMAHISISALAAFVLTLPFLIFQLWLFVKPALYRSERRVVGQSAIVIVLLFLLGCGFAYYILTPLSVLFLGNYVVSDLVKNTITLDSYLSVFTTTMVLTGLLFELPVALGVLSRLGFVTASTLRRFRKHAIVVGLVLSAIITPTTDPFTMTVVAIPLYLLFEISIISVANKEKRNARQNNS